MNKTIGLMIAVLICLIPLAGLADPEGTAPPTPRETETAAATAAPTEGPDEASPAETADKEPPQTTPDAGSTPVPSDTPHPTAAQTPAPTGIPQQTEAPTPSAAKTARPSPVPTEAEHTPGGPTASPAQETPSPVPTVPGTLAGLRIDTETVYEDMDKSYAQGYIPRVAGGKVSLVLPLTGSTADGQVILSLDLGETSDSPFVYGNYSRTVKEKDGLYLFRFSIPLARGRINGHYPILCRAEYLDGSGMKCEQTFTLYVTVADGKNPPDPNSVTKEAAQMPELFVRSCEIRPESVQGGGSFKVSLEIENIGNLRARNIKLNYGSETESIRPQTAESTQLLGNTDPGETVSAQFEMLAGEETLSGQHAFHVTLEYRDAYGGNYTLEQSYPIRITQPASFSFDPPIAPKEAHAGETFILPANVFNTGRSELRQVTVRAEGPGLFPVASAFLGDIGSGEAGYGEIHVFVGFLSMSEGFSEKYGLTNGRYTVSFLDEAGEEHAETVEFPLTILAPEAQPTPTPVPEDKTGVRDGYLTSLWVGLALIAALASWIVTAQVLRKVQIGTHEKR